MIGDVRGSGLFIGVELVSDRDSLQPASEETHRIVNDLRENQVLVGIDGPHHNVLKIRPPVVFSESHVDILVARLDQALSR